MLVAKEMFLKTIQQGSSWGLQKHYGYLKHPNFKRDLLGIVFFCFVPVM